MLSLKAPAKLGTHQISYRVAEQKDHDSIVSFLREHYFKDEWMSVSYTAECDDTAEEEKFLMTKLRHETVMVATDTESEMIVGTLFAGPIKPGHADANVEAAVTQKWRDICLFMAYIDKKADVFRRFNTSNFFCVFALSVHKDYREQKIGEKLASLSAANAKRLNYKFVATDCTSSYTARMAQNNGMENISTVTFDEYNQLIGRRLFNLPYQNHEIKTFVKQF